MELGAENSSLRLGSLTFFLCKMGIIKAILPTSELKGPKGVMNATTDRTLQMSYNSELLPLAH